MNKGIDEWIWHSKIEGPIANTVLSSTHICLEFTIVVNAQLPAACGSFSGGWSSSYLPARKPSLMDDAWSHVNNHLFRPYLG